MGVTLSRGFPPFTRACPAWYATHRNLPSIARQGLPTGPGCHPGFFHAPHGAQRERRTPRWRTLIFSSDVEGSDASSVSRHSGAGQEAVTRCAPLFSSILGSRPGRYYAASASERKRPWPPKSHFRRLLEPAASPPGSND
jgi:hypothetical protein